MLDFVGVKIINTSDNELPKYSKHGDSGVDVRASEEWYLGGGETIAIPTGLYVEIPYGYEIQVRPRSGLAYKHGITVLNSHGTIDPDYRGEIGVILINLSEHNFQINNGDRIAQLVFAKYETVDEFVIVDKLSETERGEGGFGHTGKE